MAALICRERGILVATSSPRWYVKRVLVEGLGGRKKTYEQDLNPDVNVFFGLNGSGKTTLLRIIHCALSEEMAPIIGAPFRHATVEIELPERDMIVVRDFEMPDEVHIEAAIRRAIPPSMRNRPGARLSPRVERLVQETFSWDTSYVYLAGEPSNTENVQASGDFPHRYLPTSRIFDARDISNEAGDRNLDEYFADSIQRLWSNYSAKVLAAVRQAQEDGLGRILAGVISPEQNVVADWELDYDKAFIRVTNFLRRRGALHLVLDREGFLNRFDSDSAFKRVVVDINEVEERIESALEPRTKLQTLVSRLISGPKQINFLDTQIRAVTAENKDISLEKLSSGERQLIRILVEALSADGRPIIIDEPELSMHVDWQQVLIESIRTIDEDAQVITATHSPEIMADIADEKIFRL
ncbi:AAA family ATPase [Streptomyces achromogenes]|uniref:AAA family ATPase n=1 Tax=Streptomyces achromogenes TaxID=67255 RepID=UPI00099BC08C|nr:AAA family ATPase [Streptomyces achromogenes]